MLDVTKQETIVTDWKNALKPYGAVITDDGQIARNGKVTGVRVVSKGNKLQIVASESGKLLASGPASPETLTRFVEAFWFWKPGFLVLGSR